MNTSRWRPRFGAARGFLEVSRAARRSANSLAPKSHVEDHANRLQTLVRFTNKLPGNARDIDDNDENFNEQNEKNQGLEGLGLLHGGDWDKKLLQNTQDYGYDGEESEEDVDEEDETKSKQEESEENNFNFDL